MLVTRPACFTVQCSLAAAFSFAVCSPHYDRAWLCLGTAWAGKQHLTAIPVHCTEWQQLECQRELKSEGLWPEDESIQEQAHFAASVITDKSMPEYLKASVTMDKADPAGVWRDHGQWKSPSWSWNEGSSLPSKALWPGPKGKKVETNGCIFKLLQPMTWFAFHSKFFYWRNCWRQKKMSLAGSSASAAETQPEVSLASSNSRSLLPQATTTDRQWVMDWDTGVAHTLVE